MDPSEEVLGKSLLRQSKLNLFFSGLFGLLVLVFKPAIAVPRATLESCKERGCGPCSSTLGPCLAGRGAAQKHGWAQEKKRGDLGEGGLAPYASPWDRPSGAGVLLFKWFHLRFWDLTAECRGHLLFLKAQTGRRWRRELGKGAGRRLVGGSAQGTLDCPRGARPL